MAYGPMKARSELVSLRAPGVLGVMKSFDGGVFETTRRFHAASPAFIHPARRPTRGSGLGAAVERSGRGAAPIEADEEDDEEAHAAREASATQRRKDAKAEGRKDGWTEGSGVTGFSPGSKARRASHPSGRSRWSGRRSHRRRT